MATKTDCRENRNIDFNHLAALLRELCRLCSRWGCMELRVRIQFRARTDLANRKFRDPNRLSNTHTHTHTHETILPCPTCLIFCCSVIQNFTSSKTKKTASGDLILGFTKLSLHTRHTPPTESDSRRCRSRRHQSLPHSTPEGAAAAAPVVVGRVRF